MLNEDMHRVVACSTASSHEDLHEEASSPSRAYPNSQSVVPSTVPQGMNLCLEIRSTTTVHSDQQILPSIFDYWVAKMFHPPIFNMYRSSQPSDQFWHPSRSSSRIFHPSRRSEPILHPSRPSDHFSKFSPQGRRDMSNSQPIHLIHFS